MSGKGNFETAYALSPLQEGLLFHALYAPQEGVYLDQLSWLLDGPEPLDTAALRNAWRRVVERHAVLRTAFSWKRRGSPLQAVLRRVEVPVEEHDWTSIPEAGRRERLQDFLRADRSRGFDFARPPLLRVALMRLSERTWRCVLTYHHVLMDAWSLSLVLREVFAFYAAFRQGRDLQLPLPRPYAEYIAWLRRQDLSLAEAFWRRELAGFSAPTRLWVDAVPGRADREEGYASRTRHLSEGATAALNGFARRNRLTVNNLLQAAWGLLLSRYSSDRDVVFGATVSGRPDDLPGVESMVGLFINTLPFRVRMEPESELLPWVREIQARQVELRQFEFSPLVEVQGWSEVPRSLPLFETILVFENATMLSASGPADATGAEVRDLTYEPRSSYAASLMVAPGARLSLRILHPCDRLDAATVGRMLGHLATLLESMPEGGDRRLPDLPLLTAVEREQLLAEWQDTASGAVRQGSIHDLFLRQAERAPEAPAVLFGDEVVTYGDLRRRSNRLACHLRSILGHGALVGILLDRSADLVTAVLGVLEAGCAYVPIDVSFPRARLQWILGSLAVPCVITEGARLETLRELEPDLPDLRDVVCLDGTETDWRRGDEPAGQVGPEDLAYIIFTSGSTGNPKGVMVRHEPVLNLIEWVNRTFGVGPADRVLFITSLTFDLSVYDIFGILAAGGSIRVASSAEVREPRQLLRALLEEPITFWDSAPAALQQLVPFLAGEGRGGAEPPALRLVFLSGDWIPVGLPGPIRETFPGARIVGLGGATEATVWSNSFPIQEVDPSWVSIPYGRPMQDARYLVLDEALSPCPVGVPGDLYIGGVCLASGYAGEPALTAGKFVPDPFSAEPGARLYRTGDRARFWPDGLIEFLGRLDQQVKIRGFRIELGEIEAVLGRHPAVREAVVLAREDRAGDRRLVAYVVPCQGCEARPVDLRSFLAESLPEPMLPSAFVVLEALPVTSNGKLDRRALPEPDQPTEGSADASLFRTPTEELLAGLWAETLGLGAVGVQDNFFDLGGHSLRATQVVSRIRETFGAELGVRSVFEAPTVAELALRIDEARAGGPEAPAVERLAGRSAAPLSFTQRRLWFLEQMAAGDPAYQIPFAMRFQGRLDVLALDAALAAVVQRHESLRTVFRVLGDEPVQLVGPDGGSSLLLADLAALPEALREPEARARVRAQVQSPFDLARGPLLRVSLLRLGESEHILVLTLHHIVSDAWSMGILFSELARLYRAAVEGRPLALPDLRYQYVDYAAWQQRLLRPERLEAELDYWRGQLADAPPALELPGARPRPSGAGLRGGTEPLLLSLELSQALRELSRKEGVTLFMILLAGLGAVLHHDSGSDDVVVGTNLANRHRGEFEGVIGAFVNTLALRLSLAGDPTFRELLGRVRERALGAYAHQDIPFERIVEDLRRQRPDATAPLFQVMLVLQDVPGAASLEIPGLSLRSVDLERRSANFDITLFLYTERERLAGTLEYNAGLYDAPDMRRLVECFQELLRKAVEDPAVRLSDLSPARETVLEGFSDDLEDF
ncbi:MAG: amino acid adenylation domain-containing protein [Acidobacteriota bacterium]